jgi:hypothetical protein
MRVCRPETVSPMIKWFRDGAPLYVKNLQLPTGQQLLYRYVIVNADDKDKLKWEKIDK